MPFATHIDHLMPRALRVVCPCAHCVSEVTGRRLLDPATVPDDLGLVDMQPVGNYAYRLLFDDGHDSGIYSWEYLYRLGADRERLWADYLEELEAAGKSRASGVIFTSAV